MIDMLMRTLIMLMVEMVEMIEMMMMTVMMIHVMIMVMMNIEMTSEIERLTHLFNRTLLQRNTRHFVG